jgi:hypothetical protein
VVNEMLHLPKHRLDPTFVSSSSPGISNRHPSSLVSARCSTLSWHGTIEGGMNGTAERDVLCLVTTADLLSKVPSHQ